MFVRHRIPVVATLFVCVSAAAFVAVAPATAETVQLPPQLVAALQRDRAASNAALAASRTQLATAALAQRAASAVAGQARTRARLVRAVASLGPLTLPPRARDTIEQVTDVARADLKRADARLDAATEHTARAQAAALDADRRIRALQRATATHDDRDSSFGSWHFGSGGPAVSAETIDRYLESKGSPMAGQGEAFLKAGVKYELDPRLVVAIAGAESYFGITLCAPFNGWGWGCPSGPYAFSSWQHAIDTVSRGIREGYIDDGLTSVGRIHLRYAPPDAANDPTDLNYGWADNVARFLVEQGGDPQRVDGVRDSVR